MQNPQGLSGLMVAMVIFGGCLSSDLSIAPDRQSEASQASEPGDACGRTTLERRMRSALGRAEGEDPQSAQVAEILTDLARLCTAAGRRDLAVRYYDRALGIFEGLSSPPATLERVRGERRALGHSD